MVVRKIVKIDEEKCNGCGECIPNCEEGALQIVDGVAKIIKEEYCDGLGACLGHCPQDAIEIIEREAADFDEEAVHEHMKTFDPVAHGGPPVKTVTSALTQWPVQLNLVPVKAPQWDNADLLIMADCVPVAHPTTHSELIKGRKLVIGCPKFDNGRHYVTKLAEILKQNDINSMTVAIMEVSCCGGLQRIAELALEESGKMIPTQKLVIGVKGGITRA